MVGYMASDYLHESAASHPVELEAERRVLLTLPPKKRAGVDYNQQNIVQQNAILDHEHSYQEIHRFTKPRSCRRRRPRTDFSSWVHVAPTIAIVPRRSRSMAIVPVLVGEGQLHVERAIVNIGVGCQSDDNEDMYSRIKRRKRRTVRDHHNNIQTTQLTMAPREEITMGHQDTTIGSSGSTGPDRIRGISMRSVNSPATVSSRRRGRKRIKKQSMSDILQRALPAPSPEYLALVPVEDPLPLNVRAPDACM